MRAHGASNSGNSQYNGVTQYAGNSFANGISDGSGLNHVPGIWDGIYWNDPRAEI